jgi:hypothetical protein
MKFLFAAPTFLCVTALVVFDAGAMSMPATRAAGSSASLASIQDGAQASLPDAVSGVWLLTFATGGPVARQDGGGAGESLWVADKPWRSGTSVRASGQESGTHV